NSRQQQRAGRPYRTVNPLAELLEALGIIAETDSAARCYTLTGGSIKRSLRGETESEFYASYARAIGERFPGRWISKVVAQALPVAEQQAFKDAGVRIYHPNYEVWDARLFEILCPGKAAHVGREEWLTRILAAREVFGAENVIPNFVAGIEMARPHGFESVDDAIASTGEGLEWFMSRGVCPRYTVWCPEPLSDLVRSRVSQGKALLRTWRDTHRRHRLPVPPGYGPPGPGRALFSVSSFMDVIEA
ncbi:MAG: radical SAM protein, partial [Planctomycetota bacterium]